MRTKRDASTSGGQDSFCLSATVTLSDAVTGGAWSSSITTVASIDPSSGNAIGVATGTSIITYSVTNGCGTETTTYGVTVFIVTISVPGGSATVCPADSGESGVITWFTGSSNWGVWSSSNTAIATTSIHSADSGWVTGILPGTITLTYTYLGCVGTQIVTVTPVPNAGSIMPSPIPFTSYSYPSSAGTLTASGADLGDSYFWELDGTYLSLHSGSSVHAMIVTVDSGPPATGVGVVFIITDGYGCINLATYDVTISP